MLYIWYDKSYGNTGPIYEKSYKITLDAKKIMAKYAKSLRITLNINKLLTIIPKKYHIMINTFNSKKLFVEHMINNNISEYIPKTYFSDPICYPCIIKPIIGIGGISTIIFKNNTEYSNSTIKYNSSFIIQDYVESDNTNVAHILCNHGQIVKSIIYFAQTPEKYYVKKGKINNYKKRLLNDVEKNIFGKILFPVSYHGMCDIDYVYDKNGSLKIFEINPRMGGSLFYDNVDFHDFVKCIEDNNIFYN